MSEQRGQYDTPREYIFANSTRTYSYKMGERRQCKILARDDVKTSIFQTYFSFIFKHLSCLDLIDKLSTVVG